MRSRESYHNRAYKSFLSYFNNLIPFVFSAAWTAHLSWRSGQSVCWRTWLSKPPCTVWTPTRPSTRPTSKGNPTTTMACRKEVIETLNRPIQYSYSRFGHGYSEGISVSVVANTTNWRDSVRFLLDILLMKGKIWSNEVQWGKYDSRCLQWSGTFSNKNCRCNDSGLKLNFCLLQDDPIK